MLVTPLSASTGLTSPAFFHSSISGRPLQPASPACRPCLCRRSIPHSPRISEERISCSIQSPSSQGAKVQTGVAKLVDFFKQMLDDAAARLSPSAGQDSEPSDEVPPPTRTVLVVGATGRTGRHIVGELLSSNCSVVALVASQERAQEVLSEAMGFDLAPSSPAASVATATSDAPRLRTIVGDILDEQSLKAAIQGCDGVVCAVGSRFGPNGPVPGATVQDIYGKGIPILVRVAAKAFREQEGGERVELALFDFEGKADGQNSSKGAAAGEGEGDVGRAPPVSPVPNWSRFDDVIMGGGSESSMLQQQQEGCALFSGTVRVEGGGFCATRAPLPAALTDLSPFDGISLMVQGDGQRYKMNLRSTEERSEFQHQASFDTIPGVWLRVDIPFDRFFGVQRSRLVPDAPPLDTSCVKTMGIVLSRFQRDGFPNPLFSPGEFSLKIRSISAFSSPRPQFVLLSSAAVERSARAEKEGERMASIPIVQLNPGGILSWKLSSEDFLRSSGLRYSIVRPCGLTDKDEDEDFYLEVAQGDCITGLLSRQEAARVSAAALLSPDSVGTTFEVKRDDLTKGMRQESLAPLFFRLRRDIQPGLVQYPAVPKELAEAFNE